MKKQKGKRKKGGLSRLLLRLAVVGISLYLLLSFIGGQLEVSAKQKELNEITTQVDLQAEKNAELQALMESGDQDAYIERVAREKMGYARPDERVFVDISG